MSDEPCYICRVRPSDLADRDTEIERLNLDAEARKQQLLRQVEIDRQAIDAWKSECQILLQRAETAEAQVADLKRRLATVLDFAPTPSGEAK